MEFVTSKAVFDYCTQNNIECNIETANKFDILSDMLIKFNEHTNVTALKTPQDIANKHFIDSLSILTTDIVKPNASIIDIGCGAGFPGLPIKVLRPDVNMTFVDSTAKKLKFTKSVCDEFSIENVEIFPERAEELVAKGHREKYDLAISRAVASLPVLLELVLPYVKVGGMFVAYKSTKEVDIQDKQSELCLSKKAISILGARLEKVHIVEICQEDGSMRNHALAIFKKVKNTPTNYPRRYASIVKKPL